MDWLVDIYFQHFHKTLLICLVLPPRPNVNFQYFGAGSSFSSSYYPSHYSSTKDAVRWVRGQIQLNTRMRVKRQCYAGITQALIRQMFSVNIWAKPNSLLRHSPNTDKKIAYSGLRYNKQYEWTFMADAVHTVLLALGLYVILWNKNKKDETALIRQKLNQHQFSNGM